MRIVLPGIGASRGMALGRARLVQPSQFIVDETPLEPEEIDDEAERLQAALETARTELRGIRDKLHGALAREIGEFIDAHSLLLSDPDLISGLFDLVRRGRYRAGAALKMQRDRLAAVFEAMDDPYLRSRREDIDHVIGRVQSALARETSSAERQIAARVGTILVSDQIAPAEMTHLAQQGVLGVVCTGSSALSHSAILARSMRLPMAVGAHDALAAIRDDDLVLLDGEHGEVVVHPTAQDLARYRQAQREAQREGRRLAQLAHAETRTRDGSTIRLFANAELPNDVAQARANGADGIGLYRTEFLFLQRHHLPDEDEQFQAYRELVLGMGGLPVTIRTLDLGADKADTTGLALTREPNPALGMRGVRLSMHRPALFATQMRAILRASAYGPIRILVPMVTSAEELRATRALVDICARDLRSEGHEIADHFDLGAMIEVPAAAIALPSMIGYVDFVAIGTNDLVQYTLAADRNNDTLSHLYDPLHPAILRLVADTIKCGHKAGKAVSLCGEMASDTRYTALLLALGLTEFSMHSGALLEVRDRIAGCERPALLKLAPKLLRADREGITAILARL
ncbi:phosphoenolpyruvate--protein phosphotransferase [Tahibacter amnicola]|uniref:Phosphoenolpyruvate-protein phosphotransferase n=1 Tax=Tahibacter amnicola TaxID=2976241 RepID=A0ABY6BM89_9GAMM|nr:phosphoenolpyruvate--protein phosphotransferase [Tahibacter amnicola]UXI70741.1 phosphoenolpyruvate--protein phosphotransferase [Tahibacter amnicola]